MANDFYTETPVTTDDWSGSSKGFKTASYGGLIEGLGDALSMGVKAYDQYNQGMIKEEARQKTTQLMDEYGNSAAVDTQTGVDSTATPKEINDGVKRLQLLKSATVAGTLKSSAYWAQAELMSRQLKNRYPGYWEYVDQAFSSELGAKPDIRLQSELQQERDTAASEAKAAANRAENERNNALNAARSIGLQEVFIDEARGKRWSTEAINLAVSGRQNIEYTQQSQLRKYELDKKNGEATETEALKTMRTELNHQMVTGLGDTTAILGRSKKEYETLVGQANAQRAAGGPVDPQLEQQIGAAATAFQGAFNDRLNQLTLKWSQDLPGEKVKGEVEVYSNYLKKLTSAVQEKDTVVVGHNLELINSIKNADAATVLLKPGNDAIRRESAIMNIMPPDIYRDFRASQFDQPWRTELDRIYVSNILNGNLLNRPPISKGVTELRDAGVKSPQAFNNYITSVVDAATDPKIPANLRENALVSIYGPENIDFLWKPDQVKANERLPLFVKFTAPEKLQAIKKAYDKGEISAETFDAVQKWGTTNAMRLMQQESSAINSINVSRKGLEVSYNPTTHYLNLKDKPYTVSGNTMMSRFVNEVAEGWMIGEGQDSVNRVNNVIRNVKALVEVAGEDPKEIIPAILGRSGISFNDPEKVEETGSEALVKFVEDSINEAITGLVASTSKTFDPAVEKVIETAKPRINEAINNLRKSFEEKEKK